MKRSFLIISLCVLSTVAFSQTMSKAVDSAKNAPVLPGTGFRVRYDSIFKRNTDGSFSPIQPIQINGETMGSGVPFTRGTTFGGVDVAAYAEHDVLIDTVKRVIIIRKFF